MIKTIVITIFILAALLAMGWMFNSPEPSYCEGALKYTKACTPWLFQ